MGLSSRPEARLATAVTPQHPRKTLRRSHRARRALPKKARLGASPQLTEQERRRLQASAKADLRSIAEYVALLIEEDLRRRSTKASRRVRGAGPDDQWAAYVINMTVTVEQRKRVEARAAEQGRSISSYVAKVIVEAMRG